MPVTDLRPLGIGELVDRSVTVWRRHFWQLFKLFGAVQLFSYALMKGWRALGMHWYPRLANQFAVLESVEGNPEESLPQLALAGVTLLPVILLAGLAAWMATVAGSRFLIPSLLGEPTSIQAGIRRMRQSFGTTLAAFLLSGLWGILAIVVCILPGTALVFLALQAAGTGAEIRALILAGTGVLLLLLGTLAGSVWWVLRFLLTGPVIAQEEVGPLGALRRSGELISGKVGPGLINWVKVRATLLLTVVFAILMVVGILAGIPTALVGFVSALGGGGPEAINPYLLIPAELFQVVVQSAFSPLYLVVCVLFYLDMRVRREALDLQVKLGQ